VAGLCDESTGVFRLGVLMCGSGSGIWECMVI
jgi:hypothetical protein